MKPHSPTITVVAITDDYHLQEHADAIVQTANAIPHETRQMLISLRKPPGFDGEWYQLPYRFRTRRDYSLFLCGQLAKYVEDDFIVMVQWDGFATNPRAWTDEFLSYDYVGAPFMKQPLLQWIWPRFRRRVGNGGFALASRRWLQLWQTVPGFYGQSEDMWCCQRKLDHFLNAGCRIAPMELALQFSSEYWLHEFPDWNPDDSFGFHGFSHDGARKRWHDALPSYWLQYWWFSRRVFRRKLLNLPE